MTDEESEIAPILLNQLAWSEQKSSLWPGGFLSWDTVFSAVRTHIQEVYFTHTCQNTFQLTEETMNTN